MKALSYNKIVPLKEASKLMKKLRLLWVILKSFNAEKICIGFLGYTALVSFIFRAVEPNIDTYGDSIWYCFAVITTIGFGDITAITPIGRITTIMLGFYSMFIVSLITGVFATYFIEFQKIKANESAVLFIEKLENLENLSKDELRELSTKVKERRYKI